MTYNTLPITTITSNHVFNMIFDKDVWSYRHNV